MDGDQNTVCAPQLQTLYLSFHFQVHLLSAVLQILVMV